ncbi:hypothetical protein [Stackebrandtia albiflava]|uniref:hypothetical protein n=1 Tax=Stackebrandtia albiflava TaxID=406432 RepID=UPI001FCEA3C7|nr:hypothetical protein [Stackebrandtia albiflava]
MPGRARHWARVISYQTSPCSVPGSGSSNSSWKVRTYRSPHFSITRRDARLTDMVCAVTRSAARSVNARSTSAVPPSVANPPPQASRRNR